MVRCKSLSSVICYPLAPVCLLKMRFHVCYSSAILLICCNILEKVSGNCKKSYEYDCQDGDACEKRDLVCNGERDCSNGLDEAHCNDTCAPYLFKCDNGKCIQTTELCNHFNNCGDNSDEDYCSAVDGCFTHEFRCKDGSCKKHEWNCGRRSDSPKITDCDDGALSECLASTTVPCRSGGCVAYESICDLHCNDCLDGSDDEYCNGNCPNGYFRCLNDFCVPSSFRCDGLFQCKDYSDEFNCPALRIIQKIENETRLEGLSVTFRCRAFGEIPPVVKWMKDGLLVTSTQNHMTAEEGTLEILNITLQDSGMYTCIAENESGSVNTSATLYVKSRTRLTEPPVDTEVVEGSVAILNCSVASDPSLKLSVEWFKDGVAVDFTVSTRYFKSPPSHSLRIEETEKGDSGTYTCFAKTDLANDGDSITADAVLSVLNVPQPPEIGTVVCRGLNASINWKPNLHNNQTPILKYSISVSTTVELVWNKWEVVVDDIPFNESAATVSMRPWTKYEFGINAWNRIGPSLPNIYPQACDNPPTVPDQNPGNVLGRWINSSNTIVVNWAPMGQLEHNGPGFRYRVSWKQKQSNEPFENAEIADWRNSSLDIPNNEPNKLYVIQVIAFNDLGHANAEPLQITVFAGDNDVKMESIGTIAIMGIAFLALVLIGLLFTATFAYLRERQRRQELEIHMKAFKEGNAAQVETASTPAEKAIFLPFTKTLEESEVKVDYNNVLGSGNFGNVFGGTWKGLSVAVKCVKPGSPIHVFQDFFTEMKIMAYIGEHDNVVNFIGAITVKRVEKMIIAVMERSFLGSLEKYLRDHVTYEEDDENEANYPDRYVGEAVQPLSLRTLLSFCRQIAHGMDYLVQKSIIHGDLATRNVLVFDGEVLKISDFGFSRNIYGNVQYKKKEACAIPYRWAALETLENLVFSHKADVWSYGVTVWEIFTLGNCPYAMEPVDEHFPKKLREGTRLRQPERVPDPIYNGLMLKCWNLSPDSRPSFQDIVRMLDDYLETLL